MVVKTLTEIMNEQLIDRVKTLQNALNHAEKIMDMMEKENQRLQDALMGLASINKENLDNVYEVGDDSWCAIQT